MDILEKQIYFINLYDVYQDLLTTKQKEYFESYYYDNYSITEISENFNVSRNAVHDQLKRTVQKLHDYEDKLHILKKQKQRQIIIDKVKDLLEDKELIDLMDELEKVE